MRVLYLCPDPGIPLDGTKGAAVHVRSLVRALTSGGHAVTIVAAAGEDPGLNVPVRRIPAPGVSSAVSGVVDARTARALSHLWNNVAVEAAIERAVDESPYDLLYERYSPFSAAGGLTAARLGLPHLLEVNAPLAWEGTRYRKQALHEAAVAMEMAAFAAAGHIVAVSRELKEILVGQGVAGDKITVVPNGVDLARFDPVGEAWIAPGPDSVVVGFVGSLKPWHGVAELAEGFRRAAGECPALHLLVVGDGPEASLIDELGVALPGRVTRKPVVPHAEIPRYLRAMDIAVAPYASMEQFYYSPLKLLEYLGAGRAVIASELGQVAELLHDGENAVLVPPGDTDALALAMVRLANDPGQRQRLGRAAHQSAQSHRWEDRAADIVALAEVKVA